MSITERIYGLMPDGRPIKEYTLVNKNSLEVKIIELGGIITSIKVPDTNGVVENIVLGFDDLDSYLKPHPYFGALIGRYGNRIAEGHFKIYAEEFQLSINDGVNHLHGGIKGFDKVIWDSVLENENQLKLTYRSPDGEEGYPGNLKVSVIYELTDLNELNIKFHAISDQSTPVNLTAHSYFNLTGNPANTILNHLLKINSESYTPVNDQLIPTGKFQSIKETAFDFSEFKVIGRDIDQVVGGYDHNFVIKRDDDRLTKVCIVRDPISKRELQVYSTNPGSQFYTGNFLDGTCKSGDGIPYEKHSGFCIEPQYFPDSPNQINFPSTILNPGDSYDSIIRYKFELYDDFE